MLVDADNHEIDGDHAPETVLNVAKIDDSADVILYLPLSNTPSNINANNDADTLDIMDNVGNFDAVTAGNIAGFEIKHITGKQLKSNADQLNGGTLDHHVLGVFSSDVDSLNRSTVVAVLFDGTLNQWDANTSGLRSDAHYGMVAGNVRSLGNGWIGFDLATDMYDAVVPVTAEMNRTGDFETGVIVGFSDIVENENGDYVIEDAQVVDENDVDKGSITAFNSSTIEVTDRNGSTELDRDGFNTEVIFSVENGDITVVPNGEPNSLSDGRTNILYLENSFAFIAVNEIPGQMYADNEVDYSDLMIGNRFNYDLLRSLEWDNASTGETWNGDEMELNWIYDNARMNLSATAERAGTLTLTIGGVDVQTLTFDRAGQEKSFNTFTVTGDVELTWNQGNTTVGDGNVRFVVEGDEYGVIDDDALEGRINNDGTISMLVPESDVVGTYVDDGKIVNVDSFDWTATDENGYTLRSVNDDTRLNTNIKTIDLGVDQSEVVTITINNIQVDIDQIAIPQLINRPASGGNATDDWAANATLNGVVPAGFTAQIEALTNFADPATVAKDDTVDYTITLTPNAGVDISKLTADGVDTTALNDGWNSDIEVTVNNNSIVITFTYTVQ